MTGYRIELLDIAALRPTEHVDQAHVEALAEEIGSSGMIRLPILVERNHHVILDGHHRWHALRRIGLGRIPAIRIDYGDTRLSLGSWSSRHYTREDVVRAGQTGLLLPCKSTRHRLRPEPESAPVMLKLLC